MISTFLKARFTQFGLITLLTMTLSGCVAFSASQGGHQHTAISMDELANVESLSYSGSRTSDTISEIRTQALKDTAMSLGARAGLAWRAKQINHQLEDHKRELDHAFNFRGLMLEHNVLPPVLTEAKQTLKLNDEQTIRLSDRIFKMVQQAKFVTTPPTWYSYLHLSYETPEQPDETLLPKNAMEQRVWKDYIRMGWEQGVAQANHIFNANLAVLKQDYVGMALYKKLLSQGMVSAPQVARTRLGITGDSEKLSINDQLLRISEMPELKPESTDWRPLLGSPTKSDRVKRANRAQ